MVRLDERRLLRVRFGIRTDVARGISGPRGEGGRAPAFSASLTGNGYRCASVVGELGQFSPKWQGVAGIFRSVELFRIAPTRVDRVRNRRRSARIADGFD